jgi:multiple sugar transport system permease protein
VIEAAAIGHAAQSNAGMPPVDAAPQRARRRRRALLQLSAIAVTAFMLAPLYLITLAAFSSREELNSFPKSFWPRDATFEPVKNFLDTTDVLGSFWTSFVVGMQTLVLSLVVGAPAGYAIARWAFRGRNTYQIGLLLIRALPIAVLAVPLSVIFLERGLFDTTYGVALVHAGLALPTTVLITASVFIAVPHELEEAALLFGCSRAGAFRRVVLPLALPGVAASSIFTFVLSWNEVFAASILTLRDRTLPALMLSQLQYSSLEFQFAGGFAMIVPSLLFIAIMRRYLLNMWGSTIR